MLLELEQECLEVYRRKVDHANRNRAQLRQAIADREAELAAICSTMGERPLHIRQIEQMGAILKEELKVILPQLEEMQKRKLERKKQFSDILEQMQKSDRMKQVMQHLNNMKSSVLGFDFKQTVTEATTRAQWKFQDLATTMFELWNLMDTPLDEQQAFQNVTCNVEAEVTRLEELKSSKMKELVLKKWSELEQLCQKTHITPDTNVEIECLIEAIESGALDPASVLEQIELDIGKVKEEAFSLKDILDRVDKWLSACEEEAWLEEYNMVENRYNFGRGAHLTLKRAEKAQALVNKLPGSSTFDARRILFVATGKRTRKEEAEKAKETSGPADHRARDTVWFKTKPVKSSSWEEIITDIWWKWKSSRITGPSQHIQLELHPFIGLMKSCKLDDGFVPVFSFCI